jgi:ribosomal protein L37AE/L43A
VELDGGHEHDSRLLADRRALRNGERAHQLHGAVMASKERYRYYLVTDGEPELIKCSQCQSDNLTRLGSGKFLCRTCGEDGQDFGGSIEVRRLDE